MNRCEDQLSKWRLSFFGRWDIFQGEKDGDLRAVQEMLGHASIASTQVYTHLDFQHLAKVYDAAHPRAKRKG